MSGGGFNFQGIVPLPRGDSYVGKREWNKKLTGCFGIGQVYQKDWVEGAVEDSKMVSLSSPAIRLRYCFFQLAR